MFTGPKQSTRVAVERSDSVSVDSFDRGPRARGQHDDNGETSSPMEEGQVEESLEREEDINVEVLEDLGQSPVAGQEGGRISEITVLFPVPGGP